MYNTPYEDMHAPALGEFNPSFRHFTTVPLPLCARIACCQKSTPVGGEKKDVKMHIAVQQLGEKSSLLEHGCQAFTRKSQVEHAGLHDGLRRRWVPAACRGVQLMGASWVPGYGGQAACGGTASSYANDRAAAHPCMLHATAVLLPGPAHPYNKDGLAAGLRNHRIGHVEDLYMHPYHFDEQIMWERLAFAAPETAAHIPERCFASAWSDFFVGCVRSTTLTTPWATHMPLEARMRWWATAVSGRSAKGTP
eukprot:1142543-Pelagomonas_calceolata.AAC.3